MRGGATIHLPLVTRGTFLRRLRPVRILPAGGVHRIAQPVRVSLEQPDPLAEIRYTLDGRAPTSGPEGGRRYEGPFEVRGTTVLRAAAFRAGFESAAPTTATYLFPEDVPEQGASPEGWPATWGIYPEGPEHAVGGYRGRPVPADYGLDPRVTGAERPGRESDPARRAAFVEDLRALPSLSLVVVPHDLFAADGIYANPLADRPGWVHPMTEVRVREIERPASVEWLDPAGGAGFQVDAGVRIAGGWSRKPDGMAKHSFSLRFRKRYGAGRLRFPLFAGAPNGAGEEAPTSFDALRLRAGQADSFLYFPGKAQYLHDPWARDTQRAMSGMGARGTWAHLYLNGLYWGLYNVTEEIDADFAADNLGGDPADWDVVKAGSPGDPGPVFPVARSTGESPQDGTVEDGSAAAFLALLAARDAGSARDPASRSAVLALLDLPQVIDDHLLHLYLDVWDWHKNWRAVRNRRLGGGFRFLTWDAEHSLGLREDPEQPGTCGPKCSRDCPPVSCGREVSAAGIAGLHRWLSEDPGYRLAFADRVRLHLLDGGALAPGPAAARYRALADHVLPGIRGESARWGDVVFGERTRGDNYGFVRRYQSAPGQPSRLQTVEGEWLPERDRLLAEHFPRRSRELLAQLCRAGLYPPVAAPKLAPEGREGVAGVWRVRIGLLEEGCPGQEREGRLWYTRDGSDPRDPLTGEPAPGARAYARPVAPRGGVGPVPSHLRIAARMRARDGQWSALTEGAYNPPRVVVGELMYHPAGAGAAEWLELWNLEDAAVDLSGFRLTGGVSATLPAGTLAPPRGRLVLAADAAAFARANPGVRPVGTYDGRLSNGGEALRLLDAGGEERHALRYDDEGFWPLAPDGLGWSLVLADPLGGASEPGDWLASAAPGGAPGATDPPAPAAAGIEISEVLGASAEPLEDAIELRNRGESAVDVSGWWISDDRDEPHKVALPEGSIVPAGGYLAVYAATFRERPAPDPSRGFGLSSDGETVYLRDIDAAGLPGGHYQGLRYGAADDNVSFGRVRTLAGSRVAALERPTFGLSSPATVTDFRRGAGAANAPPRVGPLIVDELLALPGADAREFVELRAVGAAPVLLGGDARVGTGPWSFVDGLRFTFPPAARLEPGEIALVVGIAPEVFRRAHDVPADVVIHGPWQGSLDGEGERMALARPQRGEPAPAEPDGAWFLQEVVDWRTAPPWPAAGLAAGASLERRDPPGWSGDPASWRSLTVGGTPGRSHARPWRLWLPWGGAE